MMQRPQPRSIHADGMFPAEKRLAVHVMLATGDWPEEGRRNLVAVIIAALDEAYDQGVEATLTATTPPVTLHLEERAPTDIEAFARASALVFDVGGGP